MMAAFFMGAAVGSIVTMVVWVAYFAPKHWDWYHELQDAQTALAEAAEERDHYKNLIRPNEWGSAEQHEARIVPKPKPWVEDPLGVQDVEYHFDDIKDGGER